MVNNFKEPISEKDRESIREYVQKYIKETKIKEDIVSSKAYEEWLIKYIDKYESVSDCEDLYLYSKPEGVTDQDVENIFLLTYYLEYKNVFQNTNNKNNNVDNNGNNINFDDMFVIEPDIQTNIIIGGKTYLLERIAGCGCYVHKISQIK